MANESSAKEPEVLATFEVQLRPDANMDELSRLSRHLHEIARSTPTIGAIEARSWTSKDGAVLVMYTFKSMAAMKEFVRLPEHQAVMQRGKEFFTSIRTRIATTEKKSELNLDG
jgi:quinol monooxygenase YgiN